MKHNLHLIAGAFLLSLGSVWAQDCQPTLTASGATTFCAGDSVWLKVSPLPNTTFRWFRDSQEEFDHQDTLMLVQTSGSYQVKTRQRSRQVKQVLAGRTDRNLFSLAYNGQHILVNGGGFINYDVQPPSALIRTSLTLTPQGDEVSFLDTAYTAPYHSVGFLRSDSTFGWRMADRLAEFTNDGGNSWYPMPTTSILPITSIADLSLKKAQFTNPTTGFLAIEVYHFRSLTFPPALWTYRDGIMRPVNIFRPDDHLYGTGRNENLTDIQFPTENTGFVLSSTGGIARTNDAGTTWTIVNPTTGLRSASFLPEDPGSGTGRKGVFNSSETSRINFEYAGLGWAVGDSGRVLKTIDGGLNWQDQSVAASYHLTKVHFTTAQDGYAVGKGGVLLRTNDGGTSWERWETPTQEDLNDLIFIDADHGWAVGNKGVILQLTNQYCESMSEPVVVTVHPIPAAPTITASGDMKLVSSVAAGNQWYLDGTAINGATDTEYSPTGAGTYSVTTTQNGCASAMSEGFTFTVTGEGAELVSSVKLYPNPASERLYVELKALDGPVLLELYTLQGVRVGQKRVEAANQESVVPLELTGLPVGAYVLRVQSGRIFQSSKVLVNR